MDWVQHGIIIRIIFLVYLKKNIIFLCFMQINDQQSFHAGNLELFYCDIFGLLFDVIHNILYVTIDRLLHYLKTYVLLFSIILGIHSFTTYLCTCFGKKMFVFNNKRNP